MNVLCLSPQDNRIHKSHHARLAYEGKDWSYMRTIFCILALVLEDRECRSSLVLV